MDTMLLYLFLLLYLLAMALLFLLCLRAWRGMQASSIGRSVTLAPTPAARPGPGPETTLPLLSVRGLGRSYVDAGGAVVPVLQDAAMTIAPGEVVAVVGPSGGGKSTLLNLLAGIDVPGSGVVVFRGVPLPAHEGKDLRRHREANVSLVFQDHNLLSFQTAEENAALPLLLRGWPRRAALRVARRALNRLGMAGLGHRRPHQLSGGQQQRVAIARALTAPAPLILADEPTGSLDLENAERVMAAFVTAARHLGRAVLLVTHNPELAERHCDRVLCCAGRTLRPLVDQETPIREEVMS